MLRASLLLAGGLATLVGAGAPGRPVRVSHAADTTDSKALRDSALLNLGRAVIASAPGLVLFEWEPVLAATTRAIGIADVVHQEQQILSMMALDSARRAAEESRRRAAEDATLRAPRSRARSRTVPAPKAPPRTKVKGGGEAVELAGEPKTGPFRDVHAVDFTPDMAPAGTTIGGKMSVELSYGNFKLHSVSSAEPQVTIDKGDGLQQQNTTTWQQEAHLGVCPDAAGMVQGTWSQTYAIHVRGSGNDGYVDIQAPFTMTGTFVARVDDGGQLIDYDLEGQSQFTVGVKGEATGTAGVDEKPTDLKSGAGMTGVIPHLFGLETQSGPTPQVTMQPVSGTGDVDFEDMTLRMLFSAKNPIEGALAAAQRMWQDGECLKLTLTPAAGTRVMGYGETGRFEVTSLEHRQTNELFSRTVMVSGSLDAITPDKGVPIFQVQFRTPSKDDPRMGYVGPGGGVDAEVRFRRGWVKETVYWEAEEEHHLYRVEARFRTVSKKRGLVLDVSHRVRVRDRASSDPEDEKLVGEGDYALNAVERKLNCNNGFPEDVRNISGGGKMSSDLGATRDPADTTKEFVSFNIIPLTGPKMRFFTSSFQGLEQLMHKTEGTTAEDMPLLAPPMLVALTLTNGVGTYTRESVMPTACDGQLTTTVTATVERLK
jgi:hypothetical protein